MEIWGRTLEDPTVFHPDGWVRYLSDDPDAPDGTTAPLLDLTEQGPHGLHVHIRTEADQERAMAHIGLVDWLTLSFEDWSMIPVENVVAAAQGSPTRVAAVVDSPAQVSGAAFALQTGVDAVVVPFTKPMLEAAIAMKAARGMEVGPEAAPQPTSLLTLAHGTVTAVEPVAAGERVCVDLAGLLLEGEGMLVGSTASPMMLVHGETVPSAFVPVRPFRVNAGAVHHYVMLAEGHTCYLSELSPGDEVVVVGEDGRTRAVVVGRTKIERRPMLKIRYTDGKGQEGHAMLQNAETVRAVGPDGGAISVTELRTGQEILLWSGEKGRHLGRPVVSEVKE